MRKITVTIPRSDHALSRSAFSPNALRVLYRLHDNGFTSYLVGGCVRDMLLGREPKDFDVVTDATPTQVKRLFRNCRLVGRRFRLAHIHFQNEIIEVATFRSPVEPGNDTLPQPDDNRPVDDHHSPRHLKDLDGMILRDNVFGTPEQDASRRDFTVNALFYNIADFSIIDYCGGMQDLRDGIIRIIGDPKERFIEDPVRMIRAIRFAALLGFTIEPGTWRALLDLSDTITRAAPARMYEEFIKLFVSGEGAKIMQMLRSTHMLEAIFPRFEQWLSLQTGDFPHTAPMRALEWIDAQVQQGNKVSPPLLFALLFAEYIGEKRERYQEEGLPFQQSLDAAVAELVGEMAPTVLIPNRVAVAIRTILGLQRRFQKIPGRQPHTVTMRPGFREALDFLLFQVKTTGTGGKVHTWWNNMCMENPEEAAAPEADASPPPPRRRRRRRRRRRNTES